MKTIQIVSWRGQTQCANLIDEVQRPEMKLIKSSFLLIDRMKIIISVCFFHDRVGHRYTSVARYFCVTLSDKLGISPGTLSQKYLRILLVPLSCLLSCSKLTEQALVVELQGVQFQILATP